MKKIAEQFKLGPRTWDVVVVEQGTLHSANGVEAWGTCDYVNSIIHLENGHPSTFILGVFMHELLHAVDHTLGLNAHMHGREHEILDGRSQMLAQWLISSKGNADLG